MPHSATTESIQYLVGALRLSLYNIWFHLTWFVWWSGCVARFAGWSGCVPCSSSAHRSPGKKAAVPIHMAWVRPGRESNSGGKFLTWGKIYPWG